MNQRSPLVKAEMSPPTDPLDEVNGAEREGCEKALKSSVRSNRYGRWLPARAGEESDELDAIVSALDEVRGRLSSCGCWSTGKKLQSFFSRMQLAHLFCGSSGASKHLILRRLQCPENENELQSTYVHRRERTASHRSAMIAQLVPPFFCQCHARVAVWKTANVWCRCRTLE